MANGVQYAISYPQTLELKTLPDTTTMTEGRMSLKASPIHSEARLDISIKLFFKPILTEHTLPGAPGACCLKGGATKALVLGKAPQGASNTCVEAGFVKFSYCVHCVPSIPVAPSLDPPWVPSLPKLRGLLKAPLLGSRCFKQYCACEGARGASSRIRGQRRQGTVFQ